jgi:hypothetical protein
MMRPNKQWFLSCAMALALSGAARAQTPAPADTSAKPDACRPIDETDLPKLLENMGYEAQKVDEGVYRVVIEQDSWTIYLRFSLSTDSKQRLWMTTSFGEIKNWEKVPAEPLLKLLVSNDTIGPAHFYVTASGDTRRLNMAKAVDNRGITAAVLRREIDKFVSSVKDTAALWDTEAWTKGGEAESKGGETESKGGGAESKTPTAPTSSAPAATPATEAEPPAAPTP